MNVRATKLHEFLSTNRREILDRSHARIDGRDFLSASAGEPSEGLPLFLDQTVAILRAEKAGHAAEHGGVSVSAKLHGAALLRKGLTLGQVVQDYGSICQSVTTLADERRLAIKADEFRTFNRCLDEATAQAVTEYERLRDRTVGDLGAAHLGYLAHEMRNLLNSATLTYEVLSRDSVDVRGRMGVLLGSSLSRMRVLIDRTLAEVRLGAEIQKFERVCISELLDEIEIVARIEAMSRNLQLSIDPGSSDVTVAADHQVLASAVVNLVQNALKFTRVGSCVSVRARSKDDRVLIDVQDECGGLPPGKREELFRPFAQRGLDQTGLGLGLSMSLQGIKSCGGKIHVRDLPGSGCVFTVDLPRAAAESSVPAGQA